MSPVQSDASDTLCGNKLNMEARILNMPLTRFQTLRGAHCTEGGIDVCTHMKFGVSIDMYLCLISVWEYAFPPSFYVSVIFIIYPHCLSGIKQEDFTRSSSLWSLLEGC